VKFVIPQGEKGHPGHKGEKVGHDCHVTIVFMQ